jgi:hypothetical protein
MTTGTAPRCDGCRQLLSELQPGHVCTPGSLTPRILDLMVPDWYLDLTQRNYFSWGTLEEIPRE